MPFCTSSSTTYCTIGFLATGSISFGCDLVAGSSRVPTPATGTIALLITSRLYLMEGKEKANGYPRTTVGAAAQNCPHRPQVREPRTGSGEAAAQAPSLLRGRAAQWAGRFNCQRRA